MPNFNDIQRDILALNQLPGRSVTPSLNPIITEPGKVDIDLTVKDSLPLHGSIELNNRYSADTVPLRLNASLSYSNLWQLGHTLGISYQVAPERSSDAEVFSAFYSMRFPTIPWLNLVLQGTKQDSDVSTLGGAAVNGKGEILGGRAIITLPQMTSFFHSVSLGFDYKHFDENVRVGFDQTMTPIYYYPLSATYSATWLGKGSLTEFNGGVNFHLRGMGSSLEDSTRSVSRRTAVTFSSGATSPIRTICPAASRSWPRCRGRRRASHCSTASNSAAAASAPSGAIWSPPRWATMPS